MLALLASLVVAASQPPAQPGSPPAPPPALAEAGARAAAALAARHPAQRAAVERGVAQVVARWRPEDGDGPALTAFLTAQYQADPAGRALLLSRLEDALEALDGGFAEQGRALRSPAELELGSRAPVDELLAAFDPGAHLSEDLFASRLAFAALLNFPLTTLEERLRDGDRWSRQAWAEARLAERFARRLPAEVNQALARAGAAANAYVADLNVYAHHLRAGGERPFPRGLRLLGHWNLRDQLKAEYALPGGLARQRLLARVLERLAEDAVPAGVVNDPRSDWDPFTNETRPAPPETVDGPVPAAAPAPGERYARILEGFRAARAADPFSPLTPTFVARQFELSRDPEDRSSSLEMSEARVTRLLEEVLGSPLVARTARLLQRRLGRPLEPFDVYYAGFRGRAQHPEAELDARTRRRWPTAQAFERDLPAVLSRLGFSAARARWLADRIAVDPARGSGHALGAARRGDRTRLRTRVGPDGMDYKGFNIAVHELGHNVEQVFSLHAVDHQALRGVPSTAFSEAVAFAFQARDLEVLGLGRAGHAGQVDGEQRLRALDAFWSTYESAGPALVDLGMWRWMYAHPGATPAELRDATIDLARAVWDRWYAPVLGGRGTTLLAAYSHMVNSFLYLPAYPVGFLIQAQIEEHLRGTPRFGEEVERMTSRGAVTPDLWMRHATGAPVGAAALLGAAARALDAEG